MITFIRTEALPKDCKTSPALMEKTKYFVEIQYVGITYYIPITPHTAKVLGLPTRRPPTNKEMFFEKEQSIERFCRDFIAAIYLQTRDTVGQEIYERLHREIQAGLEKMFSQGLSDAIEKGIDQKLLPAQGEPNARQGS